MSKNGGKSRPCKNMKNLTQKRGSDLLCSFFAIFVVLKGIHITAITMKRKEFYVSPETEAAHFSAQGYFMGSGNSGEDYKPVPLELGNGLDQFPKFGF